MELHQLESFCRAAEEGSISRAADALFLTQPAVTQHVRALERELGVTLFARTGRGVRLTPAGTALLRYARQSLELLAEARRVITDLEAGASGRLEVGAGVTTCIFRMPAWLRAFREACPNIEVLVRTGRSREVAAMVLDRQVDLGLVTSEVRAPELEVEALFEEEIALVGAGPERPSIRLEELARAPLILFPRGAGFRAYLDRRLEELGVTLRPKMESDSVEAIKSFVEVGLGLSFLPAAAVEAELATGALARVDVEGLPPLRRTTAAVYRRDRYLTAAARAFLRTLREQVSPPG